MSSASIYLKLFDVGPQTTENSWYVPYGKFSLKTWIAANFIDGALGREVNTFPLANSTSLWQGVQTLRFVIPVCLQVSAYFCQQVSMRMMILQSGARSKMKPNESNWSALITSDRVVNGDKKKTFERMDLFVKKSAIEK